VIEGVVSPSSQGGWFGHNDAYEVHCFALAAWRKGDGPVVDKELTVLRAVPQGHDYFDDFQACSVHKLSVMLAPGETRAVFEKSLPLDSPSQELTLLAEQLRKPVIVSTELFGDLVLDRSVDWFEGEADWNGTRVRINLETSEDGTMDGALETAQALWKDQDTWKKRMDEYAVEELLPLKNDAWLMHGEPELTRQDFLARMKLDSITVRPDGDFDFWHDDGGLFWGHSIQSSGDLEAGPGRADIPG